MADIEITVDGGTTKRLLTAGKYCDRNITVTATGGGGEPEPPDDGKTRLYITVPANSEPDRPPPRNEVPLYIQQTIANGVNIDWGDGSATERLPGTGKVNTTHTYEQAGDYVISLDPLDGCELGFGDGSTNYCIMGSISQNNYHYVSMLKNIIIGNKGVKKIGTNAAFGCFSVCSVVISDGVTSIGDYAFDSCRSISYVAIPKSVTRIYNRAFRYCYSVTSVTIEDRVSIIDDNAFLGCSGIKEFHFKSATPPSLSNANAFSGIQSDCIIYVPVGSLEFYQTATNWSNYADKMREERT